MCIDILKGLKLGVDYASFVRIHRLKHHVALVLYRLLSHAARECAERCLALFAVVFDIDRYLHKVLAGGSGLAVYAEICEELYRVERFTVMTDENSRTVSDDLDLGVHSLEHRALGSDCGFGMRLGLHVAEKGVDKSESKLHLLFGDDDVRTFLLNERALLRLLFGVFRRSLLLSIGLLRSLLRTRIPVLVLRRLLLVLCAVSVLSGDSAVLL